MIKAKRHNMAWRDDRGSAMAAVLGVMGVLSLVAVTVTAVSLNSLGHTSSSRAEVQSVAAAESGINFARSQIERDIDPCDIDWMAAPTAVPFSAAVEQSSDGVTWNACPATPTTKFIRIVATGAADAKGVVGKDRGDVSTVAALYDYVPGLGPVGASGAGIYSYNNFSIDKGELGVQAVTITGGGAIVRAGDFVCTNPNGEVSGSLWVYGDLDLGKCTVTGDAWVTGKATMQNSSNVQGMVCSSTGVRKNCPAGWTMPVSPDWVDIDYKPATWVHTDGLPYDVVTVAAGNCRIDKVLDTAGARSSASSTARPVIINALDNCPDGVQIEGNMTLYREVAVFARTFSLEENKATLKSNDKRRIWFITPDKVEDGVPSCPGFGAPAYPDGKKFEHGMGFPGSSNRSIEINGSLEAMLYTPCGLKIKNNSIWEGQLYVGGTDAKNNFDFTYAPVGIGGANLNTGEVFEATDPSATLVSIRDLVTGG